MMRRIFKTGGVLLLALACVGARAEEKITRVRLDEGVVLGYVGATPEPLTVEVGFTRGIVVYTNGVFRVNEGRERKLREGQILQRNGMLRSPDGSLRPVFDHITFRGGRVVELRDGVERTLTAPVKLADGTTVYPDATLRMPGGGKTRLVEGEIFTREGVVSANDTASLNDGVVSVQKNGGAIQLRSRGSIVMEDGTRVHGDGRVVRPGGRTIRLTEGQVIEIPGVSRRLPK